jgi:hypothetical protein
MLTLDGCLCLMTVAPTVLTTFHVGIRLDSQIVRSTVGFPQATHMLTRL